MRLTIVSVEGEGSPDLIRALIERFLPAAVVVNNAAPEVNVTERPRDARPEKQENPATEEADEQGQAARKGVVSALALRGLAEGTKTLRDLTEWIREHGMPEYTPGRLTAVLNHLRNKGLVERAPGGLWQQTKG